MSTTVAERARSVVQAYQARTGFTAGQIGAIIGVARQTMFRFLSHHYPHNEEPLAERIIEGIEANPMIVPDVVGKLYATRNVEILDDQIARAREGACALTYGPPGTQKSFVFQRRLAETLRASGLEAPAMAYVYASAAMGRNSLAKEIARSFACYAKGTAYTLITSLVFALRRRKTPAVLIVDEAQHLGRQWEMLEILRELVDRAGVGLIVAGHDHLERIFDPETSPLEQFCQRFDQRQRLPGLSKEEIHRIATAELGPLSERTLAEIVHQSEATDRYQRAKYYSVRYLFKVLAQVRAARAKGNGKGRIQ